jgi:flagellum-specific ATP synthase
MSTAEEISPAVRLWGQVGHCDGTAVRLSGIAGLARIGDGVLIQAGDAREIRGEVIAVGSDSATAMLMAPPQGLAEGQRAYLVPDRSPCPCDGWLGHVIDAFGRLSDGRLAPQGDRPAMLRRSPPRGERRRMLGPRLATGQSALDTMLPLCRGQRLGVFSGSGVGKSMLLAGLARGVEADVVVVGLIGERGREVSEFARNMLGERALARTVVIAATSDQTALVKRRAAQLTMAVAEYFRDQGRHVLCLFDSVSRFAEAHREIALAAGEAPALRAFPPSTPQVISALCERVGPGEDGSRAGDITGIFTVLVSGSDMDEPVADMVRGILDGHVVLDRAIAERGRFPAIDLRRSVSRSAPMAWSEREAALVARARALIARYEEAEPMIQAGLYTRGTDPAIDEAIALWPALDRFVGTSAEGESDLQSFARLSEILGAVGHGSGQTA